MTEIVSLSNSQSVHTDMLDSEYINLNNETHHGVYSTAGTFSSLVTFSKLGKLKWLSKLATV
jgi:hypothetical protein